MKRCTSRDIACSCRSDAERSAAVKPVRAIMPISQVVGSTSDGRAGRPRYFAASWSSPPTPAQYVAKNARETIGPSTGGAASTHSCPSSESSFTASSSERLQSASSAPPPSNGLWVKAMRSLPGGRFVSSR